MRSRISKDRRWGRRRLRRPAMALTCRFIHSPRISEPRLIPLVRGATPPGVLQRWADIICNGWQRFSFPDPVPGYSELGIIFVRAED
jgi:hypothetical protein